MTPPHVGRVLQRAREDAGLEQDEVARALGVSRATVSRMENSPNPKLSPERLETLAALYRRNVSDLLSASPPDVTHETSGPRRVMERGHEPIIPTSVLALRNDFLIELREAGLPPASIAAVRDVLMLPDERSYFLGGATVAGTIDEVAAVKMLKGMIEGLRVGYRAQGYRL